IAGYASDKWGRKRILLITALLFAISAIWSALANDLTIFVIARFIGGVGVGAASMLSPLYISESAPAHIRGRLVSIYQLAIVLGINVIYIVNYWISISGDQVWNVEYGWRWMLGSEVIPAGIFFFLLFLVPETPRWLLANGHDIKARSVLSRINGDSALEIEKEIKSTLNQEKGTIKELFGKKYRMALIVGVVLAL